MSEAEPVVAEPVAQSEPEKVEQSSETNGAVKESVEEKPSVIYRASSRSKGNIKSKYDDLPESNDADEIRRQVEFYFSEANLPKDEYLFTQVGGSKNIPFPLKQLHTFSRMKHFQPYSAVIEAVKESKQLILNDKEEISRKEPLSEEYTEDVHRNRRIYDEKSLSRTIIVKGFGKEEKNTQTQVEEYFAPYGDLTSVRLRRENDKTFKGSAFVEFADEATATKFLDLEEKPKWKESTDLDFTSKKDWEASIKEKYGDVRSRGSSRGGRGGNNSRGRGNGRGRGRGGSRGGKHNHHGGERRSGKRSRDDDGEVKDDGETKKAKVDGEDA